MLCDSNTHVLLQIIALTALTEFIVLSHLGDIICYDIRVFMGGKGGLKNMLLCI